MSQVGIIPPLIQQRDRLHEKKTVLLPSEAFSWLKMAEICVCGRGSVLDPAVGAYSAPPGPLAGLRGPTSKEGRGERREGKGREGKGRGNASALQGYRRPCLCVLLDNE